MASAKQPSAPRPSAKAKAHKLMRPPLGKDIYSISEVRIHLDSILDYVEQSGRGVTITRRGKPVARIVPYQMPRTRNQLLPGSDGPPSSHPE